MPWWLADRGQTLDRESVRVRLPSSLTRRLGNAMRASQKSQRKKARTNRPLAYVSSTQPREIGDALQCSRVRLPRRSLPPGQSKHKTCVTSRSNEDELDEVQLAAWVKRSSELPGGRM